jgi:hypothetical protein
MPANSADRRALSPLVLSRIANRLRPLLAEEERAALEQALAALAPIFDLAVAHTDDSAAAGSSAATTTTPAVPDVPAIAAGHALVHELAAAACERAEALAQAAHASAAQLVAASPSSSSVATQGSAAGTGGGATSGPETAATAAAEAGDGGAPGAVAAVPALKALAALHADGVRSLAELCSLCLERLLALARSLSSFHRYARPADDGISWPPQADACALLLRRQALRMLDDLAGVGAAFGSSLAATGDHIVGWLPALQVWVCACGGCGRQGLRVGIPAEVSSFESVSQVLTCMPAYPFVEMQAASWMQRPAGQQAASCTARRRRHWPGACRLTARRRRHAYRMPAARCGSWCG